MPPKVILSEATQTANCLKQIVNGKYKLNRPLVGYIQIVPDGDTLTLDENLLNCQVFQIVGEDSSGNPIPGPSLQVNDIVGGTFQERLILAQAVNVPEYLAPQVTQVVYTLIESSNIVFNLKSGHGIAKMWFAVIPPEYLVNY
jgi:hypothetical protein